MTNAITKQRRALPHLIARCVDAHPDCGIRLQGSVARGDERIDSDIDLTIVVPGGRLALANELLSEDNHWRMRRRHDEATDVKLDINWVGAEELLEVIEKRGAAAWYMFLKGASLRDPSGVVGLCQSAIEWWFDVHPAVLRAWNDQQVAVEAFKANSAQTLRFPTQPEFLSHLQSL